MLFILPNQDETLSFIGFAKEVYTGARKQH